MTKREGYQVFVHYHDGDIWDCGGWEDFSEAKNLADDVARDSNPEIVELVTVFDRRLQATTYMVKDIGER